MRDDRRARKKRKEKWTNRMAMIGITMVVLSLAVTVHLKGQELRQKDLEYQVREDSLTKQKADEEERKASLAEQQIYVQTKQYIEKVAKEKLGLVNKNEILLKPAK